MRFLVLFAVCFLGASSALAQSPRDAFVAGGGPSAIIATNIGPVTIPLVASGPGMLTGSGGGMAVVVDYRRSGPDGVYLADPQARVTGAGQAQDYRSLSVQGNMTLPWIAEPRVVLHAVGLSAWPARGGTLILCR